jgi:predicted dehydrogenase
MKDRISWGVLSTAKIGREKVIPAMQRGTYCQVAAIASRSPEKSQAAAKELGIPTAYGSYEELLADPAIDAIYNPLPNHLHVPWSIHALEAGKHVLCEKPIGLSSAESLALMNAAARHPQLKVMEAFMYRHHPQWRQAHALIEGGAIGELRAIHSVFAYHNTDPEDIRNLEHAGGGGLMDIGCYNISLSRFLFGAEPLRVMGSLEYDPEFGTDRLCSGIMAFEQGTSVFTCGTQLAPYQRVTALGTTGNVEIEIPFNAPPYQSCVLWIRDNAGIRKWESEPCDQYTIQGDLFARAILDDSAVPTPLGDAVANMRVLENIIQSSIEENWIYL